MPPEYSALLEKARRAEAGSAPRKHHLVPNSYLSRWADDGTIRVTRVDDGYTYTTSPSKAARETDYYRLESPNVDPNEIPPLLFEVMLSGVEDWGKLAIDDLLLGWGRPELAPERAAEFAWYMGFQATRGHAFRQEQMRLTNELFRQQYRDITDEGILHLLTKKGMPTDEGSLASIRRMFDELQEGTLTIGQQPAALTGHSGMAAYHVGAEFLKRQWRVYAAPPILITCDEPVVRIGGPGTRRSERAGFATAGVVALPLAPHAVLAMFRQDLNPTPPWELDHAETAELNREILSASARWAFERPSRHFAERVKVPPAPDPVALEEIKLHSDNGQRRLIRTYSPTRWTGAEAPDWPIGRWWN